jgi:DNA-binding HxlR family transcriptional regulator
MLTMQLRQLEQEGILTRTVYPEVPPRVVYALSEHGLTLDPLMRTLAQWGQIQLATRNAR